MSFNLYSDNSGVAAESLSEEEKIGVLSTSSDFIFMDLFSRFSSRFTVQRKSKKHYIFKESDWCRPMCFLTSLVDQKNKQGSKSPDYINL
jgi:hypothetical protein